MSEMSYMIGMPGMSGSDKTPLDVKYLEDIDKSRRIIDNLNLLSHDLKNRDWGEIVDWHEDRIRFYLDLLNKYYQKTAQI